MSAGSRSHYGSRTSVPFGSTMHSGRRRGAARKRAVSRAAVEALEVRRLLTAFAVTTMVDGGAGSLRQAIISANASPGADTVTIPAGTYTLSITGANEDACATGDLDITGALTITGAGAGTTFIEAGTTAANGVDRVFDIVGYFPVSIAGVTIRNGKRPDAGGGQVAGTGGGIAVRGPNVQTPPATTVTVTDCVITANSANDGGGFGNIRENTAVTLLRTTFSGNHADRDGGGVLHVPSAADLAVTDCIVSGNTSGRDAAGLFDAADGTMTVTNTTIAGNNATNQFGGIEFDPSTGNLTLTNSTVDNNSGAAGDGGGIFFAPATGNLTLDKVTVSNNRTPVDGAGLSLGPDTGASTITNSTISGNRAGRAGGGIKNDRGVLTLLNTTVTNNTADDDNNGTGDGGGIVNFPQLTTLNLKNTIVAGNFDKGNQAPDGTGTFTSQGNNLIQNTAGITVTGVTAGNITGQAPLLGPLADNGGPTKTHALLSGSPAIDAGANTGSPPTDQRGVQRFQDGDMNGTGVTDIGAFELLGCSLVVNTMQDVVNPTDMLNSLREAIQCANSTPGPDTITLPAGTYRLTILGTTDNAAVNGDLDITDPLTITGAGAATTTINGNGTDRVLDVLRGVALTLNGLTITNGKAIGSVGGGIRNTGPLTLDGVVITGNRATTVLNNNGDGAGIFTEAPARDVASGTTMIRNSTISNNIADHDGGGIYHVPFDGDLVIQNSTISVNLASSGDAGGLYHVPGRGDLTVTGSTFDKNTAQGDAGGIYSVAARGSFMLTASSVTNNKSSEGGGIYHVPGAGDLTIANCTVAGNTSTGDTGGIYYVPASGDMTMTGSTVSGNTADGDGGGLYIVPASGTATITNSTFSGNSATGSGGGIENDADGTVLNAVTIASNTADSDNDGSGDGGGIDAVNSLDLRNTIVANNTSRGGQGPDISGDVNSLGHNLIRNPSGANISGTLTGNILNQDPKLGSLANNGGPTQTQALLSGSPAINAADGAAPATDQRGTVRPQGPESDIGAFEFQGTVAAGPSLSINDVRHVEGNSGTTAFTFTVTRTGDTTGTSTASFATAFGTGADATDLATQSGTVTFASGDKTKTITIQVKGDTQVEGDDVFFVNLSNPTNATISDAQGKGTIVNDDSPPAIKGSIGGHVFDDRNVNQTRDPNEAVLKGFTIFLDQNRNGRLDAGERTSVTGNDGQYRFSGLAPGNYSVRIILNPGYRLTKPPTGGGYAVALKSGQNLNDRGFGVVRRGASISGTVFRDKDRDGHFDPGETGVAGRKVFLDTNGNGKADKGEAVAVTDSKGRYAFVSVAAGTVRVRLVLLATSVPTSPASAFYQLTVKDGQILTGLNFGLR